MIKPEKCTWCSGKILELEKNVQVFNPDTEEYEQISEIYKCSECKCIHVDNKDFKFIQREIESDKLIQTTDCNITIK